MITEIIETTGKFGALIYTFNEINQNSLDFEDIVLGSLMYLVGSAASNFFPRLSNYNLGIITSNQKLIVKNQENIERKLD